MPSSLDGLALALDGQGGTGQSRHPVDEHRAAAAAAAIAHLAGAAVQPASLQQRLAQGPLGLHLHLQLVAVDVERGALGNAAVRVGMGLLEVGDETLVVGRLLTAYRTGVDEIRHRDGFRHGLLRHAQHAADPEARHTGGQAGDTADLEEIATRYIGHRHSPPPSSR